MRGANLNEVVKDGLKEVKFVQREGGRMILGEEGCRQGGAGAKS